MVEKNRYIKYIICLVAVAVIIVAGLFIYKLLNKEEVVESKITPVLYKVTKEGSTNEMYLFGSIHVADSNDLVFPKYVTDAYEKSHYLACEIDESEMTLEKSQEQALLLMYDDGTTVKEHLSEETYNKVVKFLTERNSYTELYDIYKPFLFQSFITNLMANDTGLSGESAIDTYFINKAKIDGKKILEVESFEYQANLLTSFSDELYDIILSELVDNYDNEVEGLKELYENWKNGDALKMAELNDDEIEEDDSYSPELQKEIEEYNKKVIEERNITMTDKAIEYFENNQDVFFMVGTLHIVGEKGMANLLSEKGYTVVRVNNEK